MPLGTGAGWAPGLDPLPKITRGADDSPQRAPEPSKRRVIAATYGGGRGLDRLPGHRREATRPFSTEIFEQARIGAVLRNRTQSLYRQALS